MHETFISNWKGPPNTIDFTVVETEPVCSSGCSGIHFVDQARLKCVLILLPLPRGCWNPRCAQPWLAQRALTSVYKAHGRVVCNNLELPVASGDIW